MMLTLLFILIELVLWLIVVALRSIRLTPSGLNDYELYRRAKAGDAQAAFSRRREKALTDIGALRFVILTFLSIVFVITGHELYGWWIMPFLLLALLLANPAARLKFIGRRTQQYYERQEPKLVSLSERSDTLLRWLRPPQDNVSKQFVHTREELLDRLRATRGVVSRDELEMIRHGLAFGNKTAGDVMTPRTMIEAVERGETLGPVTLDRLHNSGYSRFPVYNKSIDHITGILYVHDLVPLKKSLKHAEDAMRAQVFYIREDYNLEHALAAFLRIRHHLLVVVNQYRETVGLLSLEDVIEALLGRKIVDEFDQYEDLRAVAKRNPQANNLPEQRKDV